MEWGSHRLAAILSRCIIDITSALLTCNAAPGHARYAALAPAKPAISSNHKLIIKIRLNTSNTHVLLQSTGQQRQNGPDLKIVILQEHYKSL